MSEYRNLKIEFEEGTAIVILAKPERRNAMSFDLMKELETALLELADDHTVRVVILAAEGTVFSAGHDLKELRGGTLDDYRNIFNQCVSLMETIQKIPQPVIAEVNGLATAAGCQLVATCDLVVATPSSRFATPGVKIGLFCSTPMVALSRAIGSKRAMQMLLTGLPINAETASEWGLVNEIAEPENLRSRTLELASQIANASAFTIKTGKIAFYRQLGMEQADAYSYTSEVMSQNAVAFDAQEGIGAFLEKRPPCWRHS